MDTRRHFSREMQAGESKKKLLTFFLCFFMIAVLLPQYSEKKGNKYSIILFIPIFSSITESQGANYHTYLYITFINEKIK